MEICYRWKYFATPKSLQPLSIGDNSRQALNSPFDGSHKQSLILISHLDSCYAPPHGTFRARLAHGMLSVEQVRRVVERIEGYVENIRDNVPFQAGRTIELVVRFARNTFVHVNLLLFNRVYDDDGAELLGVDSDIKHCWVYITSLLSGFKNTLGSYLLGGNSLISVDSSYRLTMQKNCNLVLQSPKGIITWSSGTQGKDSGCCLTLLVDGKLVIVGSRGEMLWLISCDHSFLLLYQKQKAANYQAILLTGPGKVLLRHLELETLTAQIGQALGLTAIRAKLRGVDLDAIIVGKPLVKTSLSFISWFHEP
ncbi:hypothetical protein SELMODRAFT_431703 [Selaginella moellendorffii]|uniref:Bulb-type lectin domain-containing protein n=1 Tax=Selaginella moellendorffii TaxID=88036 RepID=D8TDH9_SELML|nr:hypothetical protein SELMODRAFT_431703 [Selaginella moellendorffii]